MPQKKLSVAVPIVVATAIRPVATRLNRTEDLVIEMRGALDFLLKRIDWLRGHVDILIEASAKRTVRITRSRKK